MDSLTEAEIAELKSFAVGLSKPAMPVSVEYEPQSTFVTVHYMKPGQYSAQSELVLSAYPTLGQLKAVIKKAAGVV
jgi:hypothetical protein